MTENPIPRWSSRLYARVDRKDIAFLRFVTEAHDHLAVVSVVDKYQAVVRFMFSPDQEGELRRVLEGLSQDIRLELIEISAAAPKDSSKLKAESRP